MASNDVSCSPLPTVGGYDCEFVETPPKAWECPVCLLTLRDPHLLSCCGVKICLSCVSRILNVNNPCPICRAEHFINLLEKQLQRSILDLKVKCSLGCTWTGELRHLESHMSPLDDGDCPLVTITCKYGCGQVMKRVDMTDHEENTCPKLPIEVKLAKLQLSMERQIMEIKNKYEAQIADQEQRMTVQEQQIQEMKIELNMVKDHLTTPMSDVSHPPKVSYQMTPDSQPNPLGLETLVTLSNLHSNVLLLMCKSKNYNGVKYYLEQGKVEFMTNDPEEMIISFMAAYQNVIKTTSFQSMTLELPPTTNAEYAVRLVNQYDNKHRHCHYDTSTHSVRIVALSLRDCVQTSKLLNQCVTQTSTAQATLAPDKPPPPNTTPVLPSIASAKSLTVGTNQNCPICLCIILNPKRLKCCEQVFCTACIDQALQIESLCPMCKTPQRPLKGNQPRGTMSHEAIGYALPGFPNCGTIKITYHFPHGTQKYNHPSPGKPYSGNTRTAYLPDNDEGRHVLKLLRKAFDTGLVFTIGKSKTTGLDNTVTWNGIHHKTSTHGGSAGYGYPDETYLKKVKEELKAKGIY